MKELRSSPPIEGQKVSVYTSTFILNRDSPDESQTALMFAFSRPSCKTDARCGMPLDLGDNPPRLGPGSGLIAEIGMEPAHMVRRSSNWAREQIADPALQNLVGR